MKRDLNRWLFLVVILAAAAYYSGCGGGSASPPPPPSISVSLSPAGAQAIDQGQSKQFTATVNSDASNKGVNWTLTSNGAACSPACGTLSTASTLSGAATTYTAPGAVNANLAVNVTATSVADSTKSSTDVTTVVPAPAMNNPAQLPAATVGQPYSYTLTEAGGVPPVTWSITAGSLPAGLSLNSNTGVISGTPSIASQTVSASAKSRATIQPNVAPSGVTVSVCDSGNPQLCSSELLTLLVNGAPDFSLSVSPDSVMINQGTSGTTTISIATQGGFSGTVSLMASGLPNGVTTSFSPVANNSSTLTLTAAANAAIGTVTVTITGTSGNLTHTTNLSLGVTAIGSSITIAFTEAPPASLTIGAMAQVSATVSNDAGNGGADWAVACGSSDCGGFSPSHTASGAPTTYMAPASVPNGGNVTITATATSKPSPSVMQVLNIIPSEAAGNVPRFVYASDPNTISILAVDAFTGQLRDRGYISPYLGDIEPLTDDNPMILDRASNIMYLPTQDPNTFAPEYAAYKIDPKGGSLAALPGATFPVGSQPFSSVIDAVGHHLFALESPTVTTRVVQVFAIDQASGVLVEVPGSPFDVSSTCPSTGSVQLLLHPSGNFLYIAGSGGNALTCGYAVDASGALTPVPGSPFPGVTADPTGVAMDPLGRFIFFGQNKLVGPNQAAPGVSVFVIDKTGALALLPGSPFLAPVPVSDNAVSIAVDPAGNFVYLSTSFTTSIFAFGIQSSGQLWPYRSAVFTTPFGAENLYIDPSGSLLYAVPGSGPSSPYVSVFSLGNLATASTNTWPLPSVDSFRLKGVSGGTAENRFYLAFVSGAASVAFTPSFSYVTDSADNDVSAFAINANTGSLTNAPGSPYPTGKMPASIATDLAGTRAYVANTADNTLTGYSINTATGTLKVITGSPFATSKDPTATAVDPSGNFVYALDTQAKTIDEFTADSTGVLSSLFSVCGSVAVNAGTAPSSMAVEPSGVIAYVSDASSNTLRAFKVLPFGEDMGGCLLFPGIVATDMSPSSVAVHPSGNFVYVANAGSNDVSAFAALGYPDTFSLAAVSGSPFAVGSNPVSIVVDPTGRFLYTANQNSNDVSAYAIDKLTGVLTPVAGSPFIAGTAPVSATADTSGRFLYVANKTSNTVSAFSIDSATGALTPLVGSPFSAGSAPSSIVTTGEIGDGPVPPPPPLLPNPPPPLPPGADFTVSLSPAIQDLVWGESATYTVTVQPVNGFSGNVTVSLYNPPPGITGSPIDLSVGGGSSTGNLVINTSEAASSAGMNLLNVLATSGFLNHTRGFSLAVHRLPGQFTPIKLLSPTGGGMQTFACNNRISAQVTPPGSPVAPFTVQFIRDGKAYPVQAVPFSGFLGFSPNCRVGVVVADASPPSSSPLAVYLFNLDFSVGATPIGGMINPTGSTYFWNDFLFSPDDSLLVILGASGNGQVINQSNPQPTHGAYVLDMLNHASPETLTTFYGSGGYGAPVMACVDLLPSAGTAPINGCTPVVGTLASQHPNQVRVTFVVNPGAPATVQRDANGNAELFLVPPF